MEEDFYTVDEAARILKLTPGRIRQMLRAGDIEGVSPEDSGGRGWKIPMHAVHDRDRPARVDRAPEAPGASEKLSDLEVEVKGSPLPARALSRACGAYREGRKHPAGRPAAGAGA